MRRLKVQNLPIRPREIAAKLEIEIWERQMSSQYDGCLIWVGTTCGILLNSTIRSEPRKNFTIAHELGHYLFDSPPISVVTKDNLLKVDSHLLESHQKVEQRANRFAVELLMPTPIFQTDVNISTRIGLAAIDRLADKYSTSFTSTAIRYARLNQQACAVVMTQNQQIQHFAYSDPFRQDKSCFLKQGRHIEINLSDSNSSTEMQTVPLSLWCETGSERKIQEQSRPLSGNRILTLLWLPDGSQS